MSVATSILKVPSPRHQDLSPRAVTRRRDVFTNQVVVLYDLQRRLEKRPESIQQMESHYVISMMLEAICEIDINALDGFIESDILYNGSFTEEQVIDLWEICWRLWNEYNPAEQMALGEFMSCLKAAYPWLSSYPAWAVVIDSEEE